ncbi:MAG: hypothetical protein J1F12_07255 [Muribaculaceae bacterium]|nr:hypothetical protein [Muribaculaceae bacterium]
MKKPIKATIGISLVLAGSIGLVSCQEEGVVNKEESPDYCGRYLDYFQVIPVSRASLGEEPGFEEMPVFSDFLDEKFKYSEELGNEKKSYLYISQLTDNIVPFQDAGTGDVTGDDVNLYKYFFQERLMFQNPDWDNGYNFFPEKKEDMVDWDFVGQNGPFGNGYALCALYFPYSNKIQEFKVEEDQSTLENLRKSNILGAKHSNSALYTRLQFRLWHLMTNLNVTVYVPVFKDGVTEATDSQTPVKDAEPSGYFADSMIGAEVLDVYNTYSINFKTKQSEAAPYTFADITETGNLVKELKMYRHPLEDSNNGKTPVERIRVRDFMPEDEIPETMRDKEYDDVYVYKFSVLIPPRQKSDFTDRDFLRFKVKSTLGDGIIKNFVFNGSQEYHQNPEGAGIFLNDEGSQQNITLYLKRKGSEVLLVEANVIDWTDASSDMFVNPEPPKNGKENDK